MTRATLREIVDVLRERQTEARDRYGVEFVGVVGSMARGDDGASSDVDVLMTVVAPTTYFRLGELEIELEERFGRHVDLVDRRHLRPAIQARMERDLVPV